MDLDILAEHVSLENYRATLAHKVMEFVEHNLILLCLSPIFSDVSLLQLQRPFRAAVAPPLREDHVRGVQQGDRRGGGGARQLQLLAGEVSRDQVEHSK